MKSAFRFDMPRAWFAVCAIIGLTGKPCAATDAYLDITLAEQIFISKTVVLATWVKGTDDRRGGVGRTTLQIKRILKGPPELTVGQPVRLSFYKAGEPGGLFLLMLNGDGAPRWVLATSDAAYEYAAKAPAPVKAPLPITPAGRAHRRTLFLRPDAPASRRLAYFVPFLGAKDPFIARDALREFQIAAYQDIVACREGLSAEMLRAALGNPDTSPELTGVYGMLLGLCGTPDDGRLLASIIFKETEDFRPHLNGVLMGYLLIAGDAGLDEIDRRFLLDEQGEFSESYAARLALNFMWFHGEKRISPERLKQSMRLLLDRPRMSEYAIWDLAEWKDWEVQAKVIQLYQDDDYEIKRAIIWYLLSSVQDQPMTGPLPLHVLNGRKALDALRRQDSKTIAEIEQELEDTEDRIEQERHDLKSQSEQ